MEGLGLLLVVVAVVMANLPAMRRQWIEDRAGAILTLKLASLYILYCALGAAALIGLAPEGGTSEGKALALTGAVAGFILYGALTLMRVGPRYREPPAWLTRFGLADLLLLGLLFGSLGVYLWA